MKLNKQQKQLKDFIKELKNINKQGAGLISCEINYELRNVRPGDEEYDERVNSYVQQKKHSGNMSIRLEIYKPND